MGVEIVQDLSVINNIVIFQNPIIPNPPILLASIPTESKFPTVIDLSNTFFSIPASEASQHLFAFLWEGKQVTWTPTLESLTESTFCFS